MTNDRRSQTHYYSEKAIYSNEPMDRDKLDKKRPKMSPCTWIAVILFVLLVIVIVICLLIFFTWGNSYVKSEFVARTETNQAGRLASDQLNSDQIASNDKIPYTNHFDLDLPQYVLRAFKNGSPKICILDTAYGFGNSGYDGRQKYQDEHIPESRFFDINKVYKIAEDGQVKLAHPFEFQDYARSLGIDNDCHVILYDHGDTPMSILSATFVWWLFKLYDHPRVTVLNGGLNSWKKFTTTEPYYKTVTTSDDQRRQIQRGDFVAGWNPKWIITYSDVIKNLQNKKSQILDSRKSDEFQGQTKHPDAQNYGRIRGSFNLPTENILNDDGSIKPFQELKAIFKSKKLDPSLPIMVYDNFCLQASVLYFVLLQAGYDAKLYDNGWIEWTHKAPSEYRERTAYL